MGLMAQATAESRSPASRGGERGLMRGRGPELGPHAGRFPLEQRTLLHVLAAQARERPDATWLVFDGDDRFTFSQAQALVNAFGHGVAERLPEGGQVALFLRNQRLESIGQLAGGIAHDLNNILAPILMGAQMLRQNDHEPDSPFILGTIEANAQRGAEIVKHVPMPPVKTPETSAPMGGTDNGKLEPATGTSGAPHDGKAE